MGRATEWWLFSVLSLSLACGSDDGSPQAGESNTGRVDGPRDAGHDAGSAGDNRSSLACNPMAVATLGTCSASQIEEIGACLEIACKGELETCYGPGHTTGRFSGPCGEQGVCTSKCSCRDQTCYGACPISDECTTCARSFVDCGSQCVGKLGCALGDAGLSEAITSLQRACDDLLACCNTLADPTAKSECMTGYAQVRASGGVLCALVTPLYCF